MECKHPIGVINGEYAYSIEDPAVKNLIEEVQFFNVTRRAVPHPGFFTVIRCCPFCGKPLDWQANEDAFQNMVDEMGGWKHLFDRRKKSPDIEKGELGSFHGHMMITEVLGLTDKALMEFMPDSKSPEVARSKLKELLESGVTCLVIYSCDRKNPDGSCAGHSVDV